MTQTVYDSRTPPHDGIRDPMQWSRFGQGRLAVIGVIVVVLLAAAATRSPDGRARRAGFAAASETVATAHRIGRSLTSD